MDFTTLLVILGLIGATWSAPTSSWICPEGCTLAQSNRTHQHFKHLPDLQETSVAPWSLENQTEDGRVPHTIKTATCKKCSIEGMDSEPIKIQIYVYRMTAAGTPDHWCRCPYDIAVGCTCVRREQSS